MDIEEGAGWADTALTPPSLIREAGAHKFHPSWPQQHISSSPGIGELSNPQIQIHKKRNPQKEALTGSTTMAP